MNIAGHLLINVATLLPLSVPQLRKMHRELKQRFEENPSRSLSHDIKTVEDALREKGEDLTN